MQLGRSMIPVSRLIRRSCLEPTLWIWRKRVGVEPTIHPAKGRIAGFEDREDHRTPCASVYMKPTLDAGSYHGAHMRLLCRHSEACCSSNPVLILLGVD